MAKAPETIIGILEQIERRLRSLIDTEDGRCGVKDEHKEGVRPFVDSWVLPNVSVVLEWARGDIEARSIARLRGITPDRPTPRD